MNSNAMELSGASVPASTCRDAAPAASTWALHLEGVTHHYGAQPILQPLNLTVARGEWLAIVGPSGCGKTTLLNLMSGHLKPSMGRIERSGHFRTVYQSDGLFPWLSVQDNIALGLRDLAPKAQHSEAARLIEWIGLGGFGAHFPHQLSGGMRQRVEIARALAGQTDVLLLDEPFSALDYLTRLRLRHELAILLNEPLGNARRTVVLVTHDIEEAAQLADRILVLEGRPAQIAREVRVASPQPRAATAPEVVAAKHQVLQALGLEV